MTFKTEEEIIGAFIDFVNSIEIACAELKKNVANIYNPDEPTPKEQQDTFIDIIFPALQEISKDLEYYTENTFYRLKATRKLDIEIFKEICAKVRDLGGEYVSAGQNTHWRIPK